ncbi:MAG: ATP-dependent RNA helicase HrpA [Magnetococcales bacterium]|nr:ATP-dependent RNA helicase HrpA [Magnetococcales bacterium]
MRRNPSPASSPAASPAASSPAPVGDRPPDARRVFQRLFHELSRVMIRDQGALKQRLQRLQRQSGPTLPPPEALAELSEAIRRSRERAEERQLHLPKPRYPDPLPVVERKEEIARLIARHQVVVLCGETGSGKTTQLPKICLELGRGVRGVIGATQPRRIAARSLATRIARELESELGRLVGFKTRFSDRTTPGGYVKLMTDGILLAEIQGDRLLTEYDTLIIDEAHERSVNIDFLLGYVKQLLPRRPDLKVIISSATLDVDKFSRHFNDAPIIEVTGRTWPVEVRYRPPEAEDEEADLELPALVTTAVEELSGPGMVGDILVFLPGEREIRDTAEALRKHHPRGMEILPLYARLSEAEQNRVFESGGGRRVVLATNVAETALTVPGIRFVVDSGLARISRMSSRSQVQRLPVEAISQASADQRKGRCGRLGPGICIRLFSESDFLSRPRFTDPEIHRSSLAAVILRLKSLRLGEIEEYPFIDPPLPKAVREGVRLLRDLGALDDAYRLTPVGEQLARLPIDPRLARMILAGKERGCLSEVLVLAAFLSAPDPRERPNEQQQAADAAHRRFVDEKSDFQGVLNLWKFLQEAEHSAHSKNKLKQYLKQNYLSPFRVREWSEVHGQLLRQVTEMGFHPNQSPAGSPELHQALLAGLLDRLGTRGEQPGEYNGTHQTKFHLHPGSALYKKNPDWVTAAELVETSKLFARLCAVVTPEWIESAAGPLMRRHLFDPHWERKAGQAMAWERLTLHGLMVIPRRKAALAPDDPTEARRILIQSALVEGDYPWNAPFFQHNSRLLAELSEMEHKTRRRGLLVDDAALFAFYDERVPAEAVNVIRFEAWRKQAERSTPRLLLMDRQTLLRESESQVDEEAFPGHRRLDGEEFPLTYHFNPGHGNDGVSVRIPLPRLNRMESLPFDWLVPGLLEEKIHALMKALPLTERRKVIPLPESSARCRAGLRFGEGALLVALSAAAQRELGVVIPAEAWRSEAIPDHLRMNYQVMDERTGQVIAESRDLTDLQRRFSGEAKARFQALAQSLQEKPGLTRWDFGSLPERVTLQSPNGPIPGYPALKDEAQTVRLTSAQSPEEAAHLTRAGLRRLFLLQMSQQTRMLRKTLLFPQTLWAGTAFQGEALIQDVLALGAERSFMAGEWGGVREEEAFRQRLEAGRGRFVGEVEAAAKLARAILEAYQAVRALWRIKPPPPPEAAEMQQQLQGLLPAGFLLLHPGERLGRLPVYLKGVRSRLERLVLDPTKDRRKGEPLKGLWIEWVKLEEKHRAAGWRDPELERLRWMLEELRLSLFAPELGTAETVSPQRVVKQMEKVRRG